VGPLLALFLQSLRNHARARSTYILRSVLVGLILLFLWITHMERQWSGAVGRDFFSRIMTVNLIVLTVVGLSFYASAITEEKEEETLGLLRMTNLSSLAILLGKSSARLIGGLLFIVVQFPFMLLALPMGGVRVLQIFAGVACLVSYTFFLANLALLFSVICRRTSAASAWTGLVLAILVTGPGVIAFFALAIPKLRPLTALPGWTEFLDQWAATMPTTRSRMLLATTFNGPIADWQFYLSIVTGAGCLVLAWLLFEKFSDARPETARKRSRNGDSPVNLRARVTQPALTWKDYRYVAGGGKALAGKCILAAILGGAAYWILALQPGSSFSEGERAVFFGWMVFASSGCLIVLSLSLDGSRIFGVERKARTLSSLMSLPLTTPQMIWHKVRGCLFTNIPLFACAAYGAACILLGAISQPRMMPDAEGLFYIVCFGTYTAILAISCPIFISWLSLRMRWGAFVVGGTIWCFGNWMFAMLCALTIQEGSAVVLPLFTGVLTVALANSIPRKLELLAAEE